MSNWQKKIEAWWKEQWAKIKKAWDEANPEGPTTPEIPGDDIDIPDNPQDIPTATSTIAMYGRVNMWAISLDVLKSDLAACLKWGVKGYHIELFSWAGGVPDTEEERKEMEVCYAYGIDFCRKNGMWWFVSAFNDNLGKGAYNDPGKPLANYPAEIEWAINLIKSHGPSHVALQTVAECGRTAYGHKLETRLAGEMSALGFYLVYNHGSRPTSYKSPYSAAAYHISKITDKPAKTLWVVSDTGTAIQQLCEGLEGKGRPEVAAAWAKQCVAVGNPVVCFYHFKYQGPTDEATIKALGQAVAASAPVTHPVVSNGELKPSQVTWLGTSYAAAKQTVTLSEVSMSGNHLNFKASSVPWPAQGEKKCKAVGLLIRKIGDRYVGGKVEWCVVERGWYDIKTNTADGYNGATMPNSGETVWAGLGHPVDGSEISTLLPVVWK